MHWWGSFSLFSFLKWIGSIFLATEALFGLHHQVSTPPAGVTISTRPIQKIAQIVATTTSIKAKKSPASRVETPIVVSASSSVAVSTILSSPPSIDPELLNEEARAAVVNILCTTGGGGYFEPISASGTIIDPRGVILTNAHVGQYFLLRNYPIPDNVNCEIRTGSPAQASYSAELLYLPSEWVAANASQITSSEPVGTGQYDYALLLITGSLNSNTPLPSSFPYLEPNASDPDVGDEMLLASYPASFLGGIAIQSHLYLSTAYATVSKLYVFDTADQWVDLFSVPGTVVSQSGSSGGAVVRASDGTLAGIIVTSTQATSTEGRDLRAVSLAHIDHNLESDGLGDINSFLSGNLQTKAFIFNQTTAPVLEQELVNAINS
ncbi:MAG: trypsin-like peptidase domain-containing protein [Patescibacteria group bacterium]|nr:trypsin-like peptidase domain-containing protein [Patescibacteria group bacterium]